MKHIIKLNRVSLVQYPFFKNLTAITQDLSLVMQKKFLNKIKMHFGWNLQLGT
jgi:hypothetical protein